MDLTIEEQNFLDKLIQKCKDAEEESADEESGSEEESADEEEDNEFNLEFVSDNLKKKVFDLITDDLWAFIKLPKILRYDKEFIFNTVSAKSDLKRLISFKLRDNAEFMLRIIKEEPDEVIYDNNMINLINKDRKR